MARNHALTSALCVSLCFAALTSHARPQGTEYLEGVTTSSSGAGPSLTASLVVVRHDHRPGSGSSRSGAASESCLFCEADSNYYHATPQDPHWHHFWYDNTYQCEDGSSGKGGGPCNSCEGEGGFCEYDTEWLAYLPPESNPCAPDYCEPSELLKQAQVIIALDNQVAFDSLMKSSRRLRMNLDAGTVEVLNCSVTAVHATIRIADGRVSLVKDLRKQSGAARLPNG